MASLVEFYADESYSEERSSLFCVAGYLFEKDQAIRFERRWQSMLDRHCLIQFHMTDCAHRHGEYEKLCAEQCDDAAREAISIIVETAAYGFVTSVDSQDYAQIMQPLSKDRISDYSFCLIQCLMGVAAWVKKTNFDGDIAYMFEAGHTHQKDASNAMATIYADSATRERYRILTYGFSPKRKVLPLQAADILAWHWLLETYRRGQGANRTHPVRKDLQALIRPEDMAADYSRGKLAEYRDFLIQSVLPFVSEGPVS